MNTQAAGPHADFATRFEKISEFFAGRLPVQLSQPGRAERRIRSAQFRFAAFEQTFAPTDCRDRTDVLQTAVLIKALCATGRDVEDRPGRAVVQAAF